MKQTIAHFFSVLFVRFVFDKNTIIAQLPRTASFVHRGSGHQRSFRFLSSSQSRFRFTLRLLAGAEYSGCYLIITIQYSHEKHYYVVCDLWAASKTVRCALQNIGHRSEFSGKLSLRKFFANCGMRLKRKEILLAVDWKGRLRMDVCD